METLKENFCFCSKLTFFDQYKNEIVIELNHVRDSVTSVLSKCDIISEDNIIRVVGVIDDISLMIIDRNF